MKTKAHRGCLEVILDDTYSVGYMNNFREIRIFKNKEIIDRRMVGENYKVGEFIEDVEKIKKSLTDSISQKFKENKTDSLEETIFI